MSTKLRVKMIVDEFRIDETSRIKREPKVAKVKNLVQDARMDEERDKINSWAESLGYGRPNKLSYEK